MCSLLQKQLMIINVCIKNCISYIRKQNIFTIVFSVMKHLHRPPTPGLRLGKEQHEPPPPNPLERCLAEVYLT